LEGDSVRVHPVTNKHTLIECNCSIALVSYSLMLTTGYAVQVTEP